MKKKYPTFHLHHWYSMRFVALVSSYLIFAILLTLRTYGQTELIKDINRIPDTVYPEYDDFVLGNNNTFFFISQGNELWNSDGTAAGTINAPDDTPTRADVYTVNGVLLESLNSKPNVTYHLGQAWTSGLYFVRIKVGNISTVRKVIKK